jgi:enoyl-CoA hydratase
MALETFGGAITMDDQSPEGRAAIFDLLTDMQATFTKLETLRIPVIAAIQGGCIGGAVDMVTACCIRYATADAFFCIQEINIGMVADVGTLQRLPKLIPLGVVKELAYTGAPGAHSARWATAWSMRCLTRTPCWKPLCNAPPRSPAKPPVAIWGTKQADPLRARPLGGRRAQQMGWVQGAIWSNRPCVKSMRDLAASRTKRAHQPAFRNHYEHLLHPMSSTISTPLLLWNTWP